LIPFYPDADIVHVTVPLTFRGWKRPVMLTVHGEYTIEKPQWRYMYPAAVKMADIITTPSHYLRERLGLDKAVVIPNAVFPGLFRAVGHEERDEINIVTVTKFSFKDKSEGALKLLRIVERAQQCTDRKINCTIIGGGKYLEYAKERSKEYDVHADFKGFVDRPADYFEGCDIFAYYSEHDNFPMAVLEGMASGLPIVTNCVGAVGEMIDHGESGLIARSDEEYANHLLSLIDDVSYRARIGARAREKVESTFSWNTIVERYVRLYEQLAS
jgi:glycosyltransferase involved in cell wall biosynthesis